MSSVSKGNKAELEARNTLEAQGWSVFRQHRKPIFMNGRMITIGADVFGSDLIAKKEGQKSRWIQVSTQENLSTKKKQMLEHPIILAHEQYEIWIRVAGKKVFKVYTLIMKENGGLIFQENSILELIKERPKC